MVYKKYIKRDGKLYGPYIYESKRVDGKVVSEYHGSKRTVNLKKFAWIFVSSVLVLSLAYFLSTVDFGGLTGQAVLNTEVNYTTQQPIKGNVVLSLKEGELLPASSKLVLQNSGQSYEYNLKDIVSNAPQQGDFYMDGVSLSGKGDGYGIVGEKQIYPEVSFTLTIYPSSDNNSNVTENQSSNVTNPEVNNTSNSTTNNTIDTNNPIVIDNSTVSANENTSASVTETSPITGFFTRIYNLFFGLSLTGNVVSGTNEITGQTSFGNPFVYNLSEGDGVQLKTGSVSVSGNSIPDGDVQVRVVGNQVLVETSYSEIQKGFGKEFIGNNMETLNVNLSSLGLILNDGELITKIIYGNTELISTSVILRKGAVGANLTNISNSTAMNVTIEQNQTLVNSSQIFQGLQIITSETVSLILTEEEKTMLAQEYGADTQLQTTEPEIVNGRLIGKYEFGNQWMGYSYDSSLTQKDLDYQMSLDKMKWLKDLAQRVNASKH